MSRPSTRRAVGPAIVAGLLAFTLTVEWRAQNDLAGERTDRRVALAEAVATRQRATASLEQRLAGLRARLDAALAGSGRRALQELQTLSEQLAQLSGAARVDGPGLVVELADAAGADTADPADTDFRIQDVDIQAVVNALWAAGAEAIAVDGQRLVSTSAARNAGGAVLVNYRVLTAPYRIEAVGDPDALGARFDASATARQFRTWADAYGLGFTVSRSERLALPAYGGSLRFRYATPIDQGRK